MALTNNQAVLSWIDEMAKMTQPDQIVWIDGSQEQIDALRAEACSTGELEKLNQELLPDCYLHRTAVNDVARVEDRTFICCEKKENAGPTNNWMDPKEMHEKLNKLYTGAMKGRTMYVIPYSMGVVGSPFAKYGIELTDSIYVVLNMCIMTRVGANVAALLDETFVKGLHAKAGIDPENRYIVQFPEENTIMSVNSGYGGNVLLGKKCFALRIASYLGHKQGWMAEHMLILGLENPQGEVRYLAAAFPSACGKTNLAMLIPPEHYRKSGWKVWCVGDDIAWLRIGPDGRLWAMNPEYGSSALPPAPTRSPTPTPWPPPGRAPSSPTWPTIWTTTPFGGRAWTRILPRTLWTGRATPGTARPPRRRALTPTAASPLPPRTAPASPPSSRIPRACP